MKRSRVNKRSYITLQAGAAKTAIILVAIISLLTPIVGIADANDTTANTEKTPQWRTVQMRVTAYCPCEKCCGEYSDGITASGHKIKPGDVFVAADRRYRMDTQMLIEGYNNSKSVKVLDRGGAIKGNRLDVFFYTHQEALNWGVKHIDVKIRID